jgi:tetratricopeptide (TPR) repeat protein
VEFFLALAGGLFMKRLVAYITTAAIILIATLPAQAAQKFAVLPFKNASGDAGLEWLSDRIANNLYSKLILHSSTVLLDKTKYQTFARSASALPDIARLAGQGNQAEYAVYGYFEKRGNNLKLSSSMIHIATGNKRALVDISGQISQVLDLRDKLVIQTDSKIQQLMAGGGVDSYGGPISGENSATTALVNREVNRHAAQEWYNRGVRQNDNSDLEISFYDKAIQSDRTFANAYYNLAHVYYNRGIESKAIRNFEQFLKYSEDEITKAQVRQALQMLGRPQTTVVAPTAPQQAVAPTTPNSNMDRSANPAVAPVEANLTAEQWYNKGVTLNDNSDQEITFYKKALEVEPTYAPAHYNLGNIYYQRQKYDLAYWEFREYLKYAPPEADTRQIREIIRQLQDYLGY